MVKRFDIGGLIFFIAITLIMLGGSLALILSGNIPLVLIGAGIDLLWILLLSFYLSEGVWYESEE